MNFFNNIKNAADAAIDKAKSVDFSEMKADLSELTSKAKEKAMDAAGGVYEATKDGYNRVTPFSKASAWVADIWGLHEAKGHKAVAQTMDDDMLMKYLDQRIKMMEEEVGELRLAFVEGDADGIIDACIDLNVFAIGTLDLYDVDADKAWKAVHFANMAKHTGIKEGRPNPYGLPDLLKPEGWTAPSHEDNLGKIGHIFKN